MTRLASSEIRSWQIATVVDLVDETAQAKSVVLEVSTWRGHRVGQHVDIRLTADDGVQTQRSYAIASAPEDSHLVLTVQLIHDGAVSSHLHSRTQIGDRLELRGPFGSDLVCDDGEARPRQLIAGGSGIVPFRAILRHRSALENTSPIRLVYSARSLEDVIYHDDLMRYAAYDEVEIRFALTRAWPERWRGHRGRIDRGLLETSTWPPGDSPLALVCGPTGFVDTVAELLLAMGHPPERIKTERFHPTG